MTQHLTHRGRTLCEPFALDDTGIPALGWYGQPVCTRCAEVMLAARAIAVDAAVPDTELQCPGCVERRFAEDFGIERR